MKNLKVDNKLSAELVYRSADTLIILGILILASAYSSAYNMEGYLAAGLGASLLFGFVGRFTEIYTSWSGRPFFRDEVIRIIVTWLVTFLFLVFLIFIAKTSEQFSRFVLLSWLFLTPVLLISSRFALRSMLASLKRLGINNRMVAIAGFTEQGLRFAEMLENQPDSGFQVAGFYSLNPQREAADAPGSYAYLGDENDMLEAARSGEWDQIYLAPAADSQSSSLQLINQLTDTITPIRLIPDNFTTSLLHSRYLEIAQTPVLCIYDTPLSAPNAFLKRVEDLLLGSAILMLVSPLMLLIALAIKLTSRGGPVMFRQTRHGLRGEKFQVLKFRTMTVCEDGCNIRQATRGDHRITRVGAFLRKTSLDELPQFFNVLLGHMSIVGPRPHAVSHNEEYRQLIPGYMMRHLVKPGITGLAQVNGWRGETDTLFKMQKRLEFDMEYIRGWSLWLDLKIILVTAFKTVHDKNAY